MNKKGMMRSLCALALALAMIFPALPASAEVNAYVKDTSLGRINLRMGPSTDYKVIASLPAYTLLEVTEITGKWAHVYLATPTADGVREGYMFNDYVEYYATAQYIPTTGIVSEVVTDYSYQTPIVTEYTTMYVNTGNSGKLHLREYASQNARSLGLYPNGTKVTVLNRSGAWAFVEVNGVRAFMMLCYLSTSPYVPVDPDFPIYSAVTKYVSTGNSGKLNLRESASQNSRSLGLFPNGTSLLAIDLGNGWDYVKVNGLVGYMMSCYLSTSQPSPYDPTQYKLMYVCLAHGHASLRAEMSDSGSVLGNYANGTAVYVIYDFGEWSYVSVSGVYGYMKNTVLAKTPYTEPVNPIGYATVRHPNGSFVYLRSSRSTANLDNVLARVPSGAVVLVYQKDEWYSLIEYNGTKGYMVSGYLYTDGAIAPIPNATTPSVPAGTVIGTAVVRHPNGSFVNLRYSKSSQDNTNVLAQVPSGSVVEVMEWSDSWSKVRYNGVVGYMVSSYLDMSGSVGGSVPSVGQRYGALYQAEVKYTTAVFSAPRSGNPTREIEAGTIVDVYDGEQYNMVFITWDHEHWSGWIRKAYLTQIPAGQAQAPAPAATTVALIPAAPASTDPPASIPAIPLMPAQPAAMDAPVSVPAVPISVPAQPVQQPQATTAVIAPAGETVIGYAVINLSKDTYVNMRSDAGETYRVPGGATVEILQESGSAAKIRYNGKVGYVASTYLRREAASNVSSSQPVSSAQRTTTGGKSSYPTGTYPIRYVRNPNSTFVYLRATKDSNSRTNIIAKIPVGSKVELLEEGETWCYVRFNNKEGYMVSSYLKKE